MMSLTLDPNLTCNLLRTLPKMRHHTGNHDTTGLFSKRGRSNLSSFSLFYRLNFIFFMLTGNKSSTLLALSEDNAPSIVGLPSPIYVNARLGLRSSSNSSYGILKEDQGKFVERKKKYKRITFFVC